MNDLSSRSPLRVVVTGISGRMGTMNAKTLLSSPSEFVLAGALDRSGAPSIGHDAGDVLGTGRLNIAVQSDLSELLRGAGRADVVIDFTHHEASMKHAADCAEMKTPIVIGTTGFSGEEIAELKRISVIIPILLAPNMSVGVVVMQKLIRQAAKILGEDYDIEILEAHHRHKKDAPSGTALKLGAIAAEALGKNPGDVLKMSRVGFTGERTQEEIGIQSLRGGDCVGEHTAFFFGTGERLEITHRAFSREQFSRGALRAARWLTGRPAGLYSMEDVLDLADH